MHHSSKAEIELKVGHFVLLKSENIFMKKLHN